MLKELIMIGLVQFVLSFNSKSATPTEEDMTALYQQGLINFVLRLPLSKMNILYAHYYKYDERFKAALYYMRTPEWLTKEETVLNSEPAKNFFNAIKEDIGFDFEATMKVAYFMEPPNFEATTNYTDGMGDYFSKLSQIVTVDQLKEIWTLTSVESVGFSKLLEIITTEKFRLLTNDVITSEEFQVYADGFREIAYPIDCIIQHIYAAFMWNLPDNYINYCQCFD